MNVKERESQIIDKTMSMSKDEAIKYIEKQLNLLNSDLKLTSLFTQDSYNDMLQDKNIYERLLNSIKR